MALLGHGSEPPAVMRPFFGSCKSKLTVWSRQDYWYPPATGKMLSLSTILPYVTVDLTVTASVTTTYTSHCIPA